MKRLHAAQYTAADPQHAPFQMMTPEEGQLSRRQLLTDPEDLKNYLRKIEMKALVFAQKH